MLAVAAALFFLQAADPVADGVKALDDGKYEAAAQAFQKATVADPKDHFSHFNLALAYTYLHRDDEALAEYRKTLELQPGLFEAELNAGILLIRNKRPDEAIPLLEDAAGKKPKEFRPIYFLAEAHLQTGSLDKAAEKFSLALELDPKSAEAHLGLGRALLRDDKLAEAAPHYRLAAELQPEYRETLLELAEGYEKGGQNAEAIALYREFPSNPAVQERLGELLLSSKKYAEAVERLEQAYTQDPDTNRYLLAQAYVLNGEYAKAAPLLEKSVAAEPSNSEVRMRYGRVLRELRQFPAALAQFQEAARLSPADVSAWNELATMLYLTGDLPQALTAFERARQLGGDTVGNAFFRAIILDKYKQWKPALDAYQQFLSLSQGKNADREFQARQRIRIIQKQMEKN